MTRRCGWCGRFVGKQFETFIVALRRLGAKKLKVAFVNDQNVRDEPLCPEGLHDKPIRLLDQRWVEPR